MGLSEEEKLTTLEASRSSESSGGTGCVLARKLSVASAGRGLAPCASKGARQTDKEAGNRFLEHSRQRSGGCRRFELAIDPGAVVGDDGNGEMLCEMVRNGAKGE